VCLYTNFKTFAQLPTEIDLNINANKGTFVVREIRKDNSLRNKTSVLKVRIFQPFCYLLKPASNPIQLLLIDSSAYSINDKGYITVTLSKGWHKLSINYPYDPPFSAFSERLLKFKNKKNYRIDIYLTTPFSALYH
jgi:hypothetical protein